MIAKFSHLNICIQMKSYTGQRCRFIDGQDGIAVAVATKITDQCKFASSETVRRILVWWIGRILYTSLSYTKLLRPHQR